MSPRAGSSPHTRGARMSRDVEVPDTGIIPAYAGSTLTRRPAAISNRDHPRIRGEHLVGAWPDRRLRGSSPHTRGALAQPGFEFADVGIIPAYAGSTRLKRASGFVHEGSSPHTRGALRPAPHSASSPRIIPAYAGSTYDFDVWCWNSCGSSPHTRGAPARRLEQSDVCGIIPAYAGSTTHDFR